MLVHRKTVLLSRWFAAPPLTGRGALGLALAPCAGWGFRAVANRRFATSRTSPMFENLVHFVHDDLARFGGPLVGPPAQAEGV
jgi:hypothetical protein